LLCTSTADQAGVRGGKAETWWGRRLGKKDLPDPAAAGTTTLQQVTTNLLSPHSKAAVGGWAYVFAASAPAPAHHMFGPNYAGTPSAVRWPCHYTMLRCVNTALYTAHILTRSVVHAYGVCISSTLPRIYGKIWFILICCE
jgi:hypothetical protein